MSAEWEADALTWLKSNKNKHALATNRFEITADAIMPVEQLCAAGAARVSVGVPLDERERIQEEGGPYSDALEIFPKEKMSEVMAVVESLQPDAGGEFKDLMRSDRGSLRLVLWWD